MFNKAARGFYYAITVVIMAIPHKSQSTDF